MVPRLLDIDIITVRLDMIRTLLDHLQDLGPVDAERLEAEPFTRGGTERFIQAIADLAVDINNHCAVTLLGKVPASGGGSFALAGSAGVIDPELAKRLEPSYGMRNVLVHLYVDIDVPRVAAAVPLMIDGYGEYVRQVAAFLLRLEDQQPPS